MAASSEQGEDQARLHHEAPRRGAHLRPGPCGRAVPRTLRAPGVPDTGKPHVEEAQDKPRHEALLQGRGGRPAG